jgi:hypothetical protein
VRVPPDPLFCPECGSEYLWTATRCAQCDVALVRADALDASQGNEMPPASELVCIRAASLGWVRGLSERLADAGVSHRLEAAVDDADGSQRRPGANLPYGVYVRQEDVAVALRVDAEHARAQIPDLEVGAAAVAESSLDEAEGEGCPACGAALGPADEECPDCGLGFAPGGG